MAELPRWLNACKMEILGSGEWNTVKQELLARLASEVKSRGIDHLSSLSEEEKQVLMLQVQPAIMKAGSYKQLLGVTSKMVGAHLLDDVNRKGDEPARPENSAPKSSMIVDRAAAGAAYLLEKWPQTKAACGLLVNSEHMPPQLRQELWRAWLSRPLVATHYQSNPPSQSLSMQHQLISSTCATVLRGVEPDLSAGDDGAHMRVGPTPGVASAVAAQRETFSSEEQEAQLNLIRKLVSVRAWDPPPPPSLPVPPSHSFCRCEAVSREVRGAAAPRRAVLVAGLRSDVLCRNADHLCDAGRRRRKRHSCCDRRVLCGPGASDPVAGAHYGLPPPRSRCQQPAPPA